MRKNFDDREDAPRGGAMNVGYQPCRECRSPTLLAILAQHGGKCVTCYAAYCAEPDRLPAFGEPEFRDTITQREIRQRVVVSSVVSTNWLYALARLTQRMPPPIRAQMLKRLAPEAREVFDARQHLAQHGTNDGLSADEIEARKVEVQRKVDDYLRDEYVPGL